MLPRVLVNTALGLVSGLSLCGLAVVGPAWPVAAPAADEGEQLFREQVRPLLEQHCYRCHSAGAKKLRASLRLDSRDAMLKGGESGAALVPGDAAASLLVRAVRYDDRDLQMPPDNRLAQAEIDAFERWVTLGAPWAGDTPEPSAAEARFFEEQVRPILANNCFDCHGPEAVKLKGGLRMTGTASLVAGGDLGPALVPGDIEASRLVRAVRYTDPDLQMPPSGRLSPSDVAVLEEWVRRGAPWPAWEHVEPAPAHEGGIDVEAGRSWWAFQPIQQPTVPATAFEALARQPIDNFLFDELEQRGLSPAPPADPRTLVRRLSFDLLGLPPTLEQVQAFAADPSEAHWAHLVDEFLARPEYGEHWARHWLDVVRYAQTNGYERDAEKPAAWRYRDWVIEALNADLPFDDFLRAQLAGDELEPVTRDSLVATGFWRLGVWDDEPDDGDQALYDELDDMVRGVSEGFLGLTLGCARCHDHKFDPLRQEDFYSLQAFVQNVRRYAKPVYTLESPTLTPLDLTERKKLDWERERAAFIQAERRAGDELLAKGAALLLAQQPGRSPPTPEESEAALPYADRHALLLMRRNIEEAKLSFEGSLEWALTLKEQGPWRVPTHVLIRGRASTPGPLVQPAFPAVLAASADAARPRLPPLSAQRSSLGWRRVLADWLSADSNPLTERVFVNRIWQQHFGRGLVPTPNDFGRAGEPPTHPALLDWLALEFRRNRGSLKQLHRVILTSYAWRMASAVNEPAAQAADPGNALLWRTHARRLPAEALRDAVLVTSGRLNPERGGRGFFPHLNREVLGGASRPGEGWELSSSSERDRRSIYGFVKRNMADPLIETFDGPNPSLSVATRATTTVPSQALLLLNGDFLNEHASAFARSVEAEVGLDPARTIRRAFERALARAPTAEEFDVAQRHMAELVAEFSKRRPTMHFHAQVPSRVDVAYLAQLGGADILRVPAGEWTVTSGVWGGQYNSTRELDLLRGPTALLDAGAADAAFAARLRLEAGSELVSLVVRAAPEGDDITGIELRLEPLAGTARLVLHPVPDGSVPGAEPGTSLPAPATLATAPLSFALGEWLTARLTVYGSRVSASIEADNSSGAQDRATLLEADVTAPLPGRSVGLRTWGAGVEVASFTIDSATTQQLIVATDPGPERRALEAFCLLLLNLNEFAYVD
ncbi:MAG: PSD1 and planctomycete cytochrome C domain-containing protein [Planctomycetota bacterium]